MFHSSHALKKHEGMTLMTLKSCTVPRHVSAPLASVCSLVRRQQFKVKVVILSPDEATSHQPPCQSLLPIYVTGQAASHDGMQSEVWRLEDTSGGLEDILATPGASSSNHHSGMDHGARQCENWSLLHTLDINTLRK